MAKRRLITPPALAQEWGVNTGKVVAYIRAGLLPAMNIASPGARRVRYAIDRADIEAFEASRRVVPDGGLSTTQRLRRRAATGIKEFV